MILTNCRADLSGSMDTGSQPFFEDFRPPISVLGTAGRKFSKGFRQIAGQTNFTNDFSQILSRIECATLALNMLHSGDKTVNPFNIRDELTLVQYDMLRMARSRCRIQESEIERICRLGLLMYLISIFHDLPPTASPCDKIALNLRAALGDESQSLVSRGLRWWLSLLIGTLACNEGNKLWAEMEFRDIFKRGSMPFEKENVRTEMSSFLWVDKIHEKALDRMWGRAIHHE